MTLDAPGAVASVKLVQPLIPGLRPTLLLLPQPNPTSATARANPDMTCFMESPYGKWQVVGRSRQTMPGPHFQKSAARSAACRLLSAYLYACSAACARQIQVSIAGNDSMPEVWAERKNLVEAMQQLASCGVRGPPGCSHPLRHTSAPCAT